MYYELGTIKEVVMVYFMALFTSRRIIRPSDSPKTCFSDRGVYTGPAGQQM
jgi:hypothetical protein